MLAVQNNPSIRRIIVSDIDKSHVAYQSGGGARNLAKAAEWNLVKVSPVKYGEAIATLPLPHLSHMPPYHWRAHILFVFLALFPIDSDAVDFTQCFTDLISCANSSACALNISNTTAFSMILTSKGSPVNSTAAATALSYSGCATYCGTNSEPFSWTVFAQEYSTWLLPYLALLSQLPFGARRRMDNLMSAVLTLGSPTLAGYSLYMTLLNARWANDHLFSGIDYPSTAVRQSVVRVLSSLQQVPLRIHPGESGRFESLVVHPDNDEWWTILAEELDYTHTWSIASATSITWVVIAYLLTVADSISNVSDNIESNGQGTGSGWLWLLPIVVGWLVLSPKCDHDRVHDAYHKANRRVFVPDSRDPSEAPTHVASNFGLTISPSPDWMLCGRNITSPDEMRIPPVFNYARIFSWSRNTYLASLFYRAAWRRWNHRVGVDGNRIPGNARNNVPRESRLGTRDQMIRYCQPNGHEHPAVNVLWPRGLFFNMVVASLMSLQLQWGTTTAAILVLWFTPTIGLGCRSLAYLMYGALSTIVWFLLVSSSVLGYYAHHIVDDSPALDLERAAQHTHCAPPTSLNPIPAASRTDDDRGLSLGENNVIIPLRIIITPNDMAEGEDMPPDVDSDEPATIATIKYLHAVRTHARTLRRIADWLRWIGKSLAIVNAIAIIVNSVFQYAGFYTNCYCDSSVFTWGSAAFNVINPSSGDIDLARKAWIGALGLALTCCAFFVGSIYLIRDSLPS